MTVPYGRIFRNKRDAKAGAWRFRHRQPRLAAANPGGAAVAHPLAPPTSREKEKRKQGPAEKVRGSYEVALACTKGYPRPQYPWKLLHKTPATGSSSSSASFTVTDNYLYARTHAQRPTTTTTRIPLSVPARLKTVDCLLHCPALPVTADVCCQGAILVI